MHLELLKQTVHFPYHRRLTLQIVSRCYFSRLSRSSIALLANEPLELRLLILECITISLQNKLKRLRDASYELTYQ